MIMLKLVVVVVSIAIAFASGCEQYDKVNCFIGTGGFAYGYGGMNPAAQVPHGPLRLGPDTMSSLIDMSFQHFSGYYYPDATIRAFSHTHTVGAGVVDQGFIGVMPFKLTLPHVSDLLSVGSNMTSRFWWSTYNKTSEHAAPGQYSVFLDKPQTQVQLLAIGRHAAIHRYTWAKDSNIANLPGIVLDMCHYAQLGSNIAYDSHCIQANLTVAPDNQSFSGSVYIRGSLSHNVWIHVYGEIEASQPNIHANDWKMCTGFGKQCSQTNQGESTTGIFFASTTFRYEASDEKSFFGKELEVQLRVGISFINADMAKLNLQDALSGNNGVAAFDSLRQRTVSQWCSVLNKLQITSSNEDSDIETMLHSANYRSHLTPTDYTESNGLYLAVDLHAHNVTNERIQTYGDHRQQSPKSYRFFSDLSLWDTFRTQHPWLLLMDEDLAVGIVRSTSEITALQGAFPRWMMGSTESSCMIGNSGSALVLEAIESGFGDQFDVHVIQKALQLQSTQQVPINGRAGVAFYVANGYVSQEDNEAGAAHTMTNAYDDFVLAGISDYTGAVDDAIAARNRSINYRNVFSKEEENICPRLANGEFKCPSNPAGYASWKYFVEGDALHWTYFAPHDPVGLISLFQSPHSFDAKLEEFFSKAEIFTNAAGNIAPNPYFWAGNEHDSFAPFLFNFGPNCTRAQYWSRKTTHLSFSNTPHGIPGNEDYGAMASWLLFASVGIFPQAGTSNFMIGSPRVDRASLQLNKFRGISSTLDIVTYNNGPANVFVEKLLVNGEEYTSPIISRSVLTAKTGCKLEFYMHSDSTSGLCRNN